MPFRRAGFAGSWMCAVIVLAGSQPVGAGEPSSARESEKRFPPLRLPPEFQATLFACDPMVEYPSAAAAGPRAGSIFVAADYLSGLGVKSGGADEIRLLEDVDGDGYADRGTVHARGFHSIQGLAFDDGTLFVMHAPFLTALEDRDGDGIAELRRDLLKGLGLPPAENPPLLHCANGVTVGHDGWLYLALGDHGCDVARPEGDRLVLHGGGILRCRPDGRDLHIFSMGLRNIYDVSLNEDLDVFVRDNENDGGDYLVRVYHSFFGADHGYPYLYAERPDLAAAPLAVLGRGSSAGGLCYLEAGFPLDYRGNLFFCDWSGAVMRYRPERSGSGFAPLAQVEFAAGATNDAYPFKPTDLVALRDGSLIVTDWADGQTPKRGRGRVYRIVACGGPPRPLAHERLAEAGLEGEIRQLESESYARRIDALKSNERRGPGGLGALRDAVRSRGINTLGRMHAVWILAHLKGPAAIDELLDVVRSETDPRVQVQAVRALGDLSDPVLLQHRLASGPGDAKLATALAALASGRDPCVVREVTIVLGRLRWPGAPDWLCSNLKQPDPALQHAAIQTMRRSGNWRAVLALLDKPDIEPARRLALLAISDRALPEVVDGLIARLESERIAERRCQYADALARVYKKPGPWVYWGYHPAPRSANTDTWERTEPIARALNGVLGDADQAVRLAVLRSMVREKVPAGLATIRSWLAVETQKEAVATLLDALGHDPAGTVGELLTLIIGGRSQAAANRLKAIALWLDGGTQPRESELLAVAGSLEDGPVLAELIRRFAGRSIPHAAPLLVSKLISPDPDVRTAAVEVSAALGLASAGEPVRRLLSDQDARVRRAATRAVGTLGMHSAIDRLLALIRDGDPSVRRAALDSLRKLREPRVVLNATAALRDPETQVAALLCIAELGGPTERDVVVDVAKRSPTGEILPIAVRALADWSRQPGVSDAVRKALDRELAELQGAIGILVRWEVAERIASEPAARMVSRAGFSNEAFAVPAGSPPSWRTLFGTGTDGRVRIIDIAGAGAHSTRWGFTDFVLAEAASVQFLASCDGALRVWCDRRSLSPRSGIRTLPADSGQFECNLERGLHRLLVQITSAGQPAALHVRLRRKSSIIEQERRIEVALSRGGDAQRGRAIFEDRDKSHCLRCHRIGDRGERIGPELTKIGGRFSRITIIESIMEPSRSIAPGFDSMALALSDGRVLTGVRITETDRSLTIADQEGKTHEIQKVAIEARSRSAQSIMPEGLEKRLTAEEFVDLIAYLVSQR
jgi:putative membrane-bound dehydrogenase-like protein